MTNTPSPDAVALTPRNLIFHLSGKTSFRILEALILGDNLVTAQRPHQQFDLKPERTISNEFSGYPTSGSA